MDSRLKSHLSYWILPSLIILICMVIYFFNIFGLAFIIAPEINREFGVIENLQLLIILSMIILSYRSFKVQKINLIKYAFLGFTFCSIFIFLEEIDYGTHIFAHISGRTELVVLGESEKDKIWNIHNQGKLLNYIKISVYVSFVLFLVVVPAIVRKLKYSNPYLDWILPSKYFVYTLISMALLNKLALFMDKAITHDSINSLHHNISEFEEVFIYYIMFLYLLEITQRTFPNNKQKENQLTAN